MWQTIIRLGITALLLFKVYGETGPWTALAMGLAAVAVELQSFAVKVQGRAYSALAKAYQALAARERKDGK